MSFSLSAKDKSVNLVVSDSENEAVKIAANNLKKDLYEAYGINAVLVESGKSSDNTCTTFEKTEKTGVKTICIGTTKRKDFKWEEYRHEVKDGIFYITGGDRRGTIYGIYSLSKALGVSPWYYFADVPVSAPKSLDFEEGYSYSDAPTIPYRGIFINDEEELDAWARAHMNEPTIGINTYEKVFELLLRLKGNYIWPAMHVNSFNMYPECGALAERMGVVVGTSHCDMLMRSNFREWEPWIEKKGYKDAVYDYSFEGKNREILKEYWRESAIQNKDFEVSYTLGMRGIHDSGFITDALKADSEDELMDLKCKLLEQVIVDQSDILKEVLGRQTLKTFVPYKEVLNLYDRGLKVPKDITLIWTNDNYGYVRRYPSKEEQEREGGNGIYYHCSYWAPTLRHYLFLSSIPVAKTLYEMSKAYENGIRKLWVCNMGAIKPLEQEMDYFISLGWDYGKENADVMDATKYLTRFVKENFPTLSNPERVADILNRYARVSDVRKVEFMEEDVFIQGPLYNEAAIRLNTLKEIFDELNLIYDSLDEDYKDAFFEMILMKAHAAYYTACMYYFADRSNICAKNNKAFLANEYTDLSKSFEDLRRKMLFYYNKELKEGKWDRLVTPEDFPPPRTGMHPASVPGLNDKAKPETDKKGITIDGVNGYIASKCRMENCRLIKDLGHATKNLVEIGEKGSLICSFDTKKKGKTVIEIDRYPSLNSVGEIYVDALVDDKASFHVVSDSNDEWRGTWQDNITNAVDKLYIEIENMGAGSHTLKLSNASGYFALSKIVVYEGEVVDNRLGALKPYEEDFLGDELPSRNYLNEADKIWYSKYEVKEKVIPVGGFVYGTNVMDLTDRTDYFGRDMDIFMPDSRMKAKDILDLGRHIPTENDGYVAIEAFSALNGYKNAKAENALWEYCTGVSYNRTNLSLYMRKRWEVFEKENAPTLTYDFSCDGGEYEVYVLCKVDSGKDAYIGLIIDKENVETRWKDGYITRYEAEKAYRYVPLTVANLTPGRHVVSISILASCVRIERIIIKRV